MDYECAEIAEGLRRHDHHKHAIFYRAQSHGAHIIRILHQQTEPWQYCHSDLSASSLPI